MTYQSLQLTCTNCNWEKTYQREDYSEEALEFLNAKSIGILYELFECEVCGTNRVSVFHEKEIIFDFNDLKMCQLGNHPIPQVQLSATPDRLSCVYCLEENENESMAAGAAIAVVGWWSGFKLGGVLSLNIAQYLENLGFQNYWQLTFISLSLVIIFFNICLLFIKEKEQKNLNKEENLSLYE